MKNFLILVVLMLISVCESFGYAVKIYDEMGNRIGTYRKEGDSFVLYDFNDKKVENPEELIKNSPSQEDLKRYVQFFYDSNMMPIGAYSSGIYYEPFRYHRKSYCPAGSVYVRRTPYIVRPGVKIRF